MKPGLFSEQLRSPKTIGLVIHTQPDGDAIGSAVALQLAFKTQQKVAEFICVNDIGTPYTDVLGACRTKKELGNYDAYIILDCSDISRTGFSLQLEKLVSQGKLVICIDHHADCSWSRITPHYYHDVEACATAELVYRLLDQWRIPISPKIATALLLGIYTDTGAFIHPNTSEKTLRLASRLIYHGADFLALTKAFVMQLPANRQRLWGQTFAELKLNRWGVVVAKVTMKHLQQTATTLEDINGLANSLSSIEEAKAALLLVETDQGYRGILRTRHSNINLGRLARLLGGQGRQKAAGFTTTKSIN